MIIFLNIIAIFGTIGWMISDFNWEPIVVFLGLTGTLITLLQ